MTELKDRLEVAEAALAELRAEREERAAAEGVHREQLKEARTDFLLRRELEHTVTNLRAELTRQERAAARIAQRKAEVAQLNELGARNAEALDAERRRQLALRAPGADAREAEKVTTAPPDKALKASNLEELSKEELARLAEAHDIAVTRADGRDDLEPTKADYVRALSS